ncbi:MAG: lysylphosphatidylglycerol synthase transmembrane domain-containing protein [Deltaproteobacteria bacterium]
MVFVVAAACLAWVFYDINPSRLLQSLGGLNWRWVVLAVAFDILSYGIQGVQWALLLHPLGNISLAKAIQAIYAGLFANAMIPMRAGELVRIFLVSRWLSVDFVSVVPSVIVGRLFDGIWLAVGIGLTAIFIHLPKRVMEGVEILGFVVLVGVFFLSYLIFRSRGEEVPNPGDDKTGRGALQLVGSWIGKTVQGVKAIGATRRFYLSFLVSILYLFFGIMAFWLGMWAYRIDLPLWGGTAAYLIVRLGTFLPNTPSNVGTYQFFTVLALSLLGVDKTDAAGFSAVVFIMLTFPLWIIGLYAVSRTGIKFRNIRREIGRLMKKHPA